MKKRSGLGKGLDALIPTTESQLPESGVTLIPIENLSPNPRQPRAHFDQKALADLAASIREHGVIQPLIVTESETEGRYTVIAGERRLLAAELIELKAVPAIIREATDQQFVEIALVENVQRADLGPLETAEAYRQLSEDFGLSHEEIATRVGKSRVAVTNTLRLFNLPEEVKKALVEGEISEGHARALLSLSTSEAQIVALRSIIDLDLNVRQTEELIRKLSGKRPDNKPPAARSPEIEALEQRLREYLGTRVTLKPRSKGGILTIHYYSEEELNSLLNLILEDPN